MLDWSFALDPKLFSFLNVSCILKTTFLVRLIITPSALLCFVLPYKYHVLTDCTTGTVFKELCHRISWEKACPGLYYLAYLKYKYEAEPPSVTCWNISTCATECLPRLKMVNKS